ncbi:tRNA pseudouridine(38/39) synthase [Morella rubra]|uniref:tRNA pseudouridine synthase n=1 Tax=Morella rubra TaxID=262757 RepID=A0A6A1W8Z9_9ROSI|nr:tRNA pseudouridine(38/39) synthase [Morella rubra]
MSEEASEPLLADKDLISSLQSLVDSLQLRVKTVLVTSLELINQELEAENAQLSSQLSSCCCHKTEEACERADHNSFVEERTETKTGDSNTRIMEHHCKRYVALKSCISGEAVTYVLDYRFYGFASEAQMDPTIESEIFNAFEKTRLLVGDKKEVQYSRCGRTDKGVSSVGQVIALFLRSNLKGTGANNGNSGEIVSKEQYGWCPVPVGFSARFSCLSREYKYLFWRENLNLLAMETAGKKFVGEHDFRNFCKMDAVNVHNYERRITLFEICPSDVRYNGDQLLAFKIKGSAFLWHQVIDTLLDTGRTPRKPQYAMAPELPLVLRSCEFEDLKFICSADAGEALHVHLANQCRSYQLQATIFQEALLSQLPISRDQSILNNGKTKKKASHVPLVSRPTEPSYEERRVKLNSKTPRVSKSS